MVELCTILFFILFNVFLGLFICNKERKEFRELYEQEVSNKNFWKANYDRDILAHSKTIESLKEDKTKLSNKVLSYAESLKEISQYNDTLYNQTLKLKDEKHMAEERIDELNNIREKLFEKLVYKNNYLSNIRNLAKEAIDK